MKFQNCQIRCTFTRRTLASLVLYIRFEQTVYIQFLATKYVMDFDF